MVMTLKRLFPTKTLLPEELEMALKTSPIDGNSEQWEDTRAALRTNEGYMPALGTYIRNTVDPRFFVGIGFGNALNYVVDYFNPDRLEGMVSIDMSGGVISMGKATRHLLKKAQTPYQFMEILVDGNQLGNALSDLKVSHPEYVLKSLPRKFWCWRNNFSEEGEYLDERSWDDIEAIVNGRVSRFEVGPLSENYRTEHYRQLLIKERTYPNSDKDPDVGIALLQNYGVFRNLAIEGRMAFLQADITDESLGDIKNARGYNAGPVIFYGSNLFSEHLRYEAEAPLQEQFKPPSHPVIFAAIGTQVHRYVDLGNGDTGFYTVGGPYSSPKIDGYFTRRFFGLRAGALANTSTYDDRGEPLAAEVLQLPKGDETPNKAIKRFNEMETYFGFKR